MARPGIGPSTAAAGSTDGAVLGDGSAAALADASGAGVGLADGAGNALDRGSAARPTIAGEPVVAVSAPTSAISANAAWSSENCSGVYSSRIAGSSSVYIAA